MVRCFRVSENNDSSLVELDPPKNSLRRDLLSRGEISRRLLGVMAVGLIAPRLGSSPEREGSSFTPGYQSGEWFAGSNYPSEALTQAAEMSD